VFPLTPTSVAFIFGILSWPYIVQALLPRIKQVLKELYVEAAQAIGASRKRIALKYVFSSIKQPLLASATIIVAQAIIAEAGISLLGLGDPGQVSWASDEYK